MLGLMKDLVGLSNQLSLSTLTFQLMDLFKKFLYRFVN